MNMSIILRSINTKLRIKTKKGLYFLLILTVIMIFSLFSVNYSYQVDYSKTNKLKELIEDNETPKNFRIELIKEYNQISIVKNNKDSIKLIKFLNYVDDQKSLYIFLLIFILYSISKQPNRLVYTVFENKLNKSEIFLSTLISDLLFSFIFLIAFFFIYSIIGILFNIVDIKFIFRLYNKLFKGNILVNELKWVCIKFIEIFSIIFVYSAINQIVNNKINIFIIIFVSLLLNNYIIEYFPGFIEVSFFHNLNVISKYGSDIELNIYIITKSFLFLVIHGVFINLLCMYINKNKILISD